LERAGREKCKNWRRYYGCEHEANAKTIALLVLNNFGRKDFYQKMGLPIPKLCPIVGICRLAQRNPLKLGIESVEPGVKMNLKHLTAGEKGDSILRKLLQQRWHKIINN